MTILETFVTFWDIEQNSTPSLDVQNCLALNTYLYAQFGVLELFESPLQSGLNMSKGR